MSVKLDVPFYVQGKNECGQTSLRMIFDYLGKKISNEKINEIVDPEGSGATWTIGLANAAAKIGFKVKFYSKHVGFNPENYELEFYEKVTDGKDNSKNKLEKIIKESKELGIGIGEKRISIEDILKEVNEDCVPLILLDWNVVLNKEGYQGHFVPIVGYDDKNVYVHNAGGEEGKFFSIDKGKFDRARKAKGTDEDVVFIYRD